MSTFLEDPDRRVVPRWRPWREAVLLGDTFPASSARVSPKPNLQDLRRAQFVWERHKTLPFAADFLGAAFALGQELLAKETAEFVIACKQPVSKAVHKLAMRVLSKEAGTEEPISIPASSDATLARGRIQGLRRSLNRNPRNPLALMDLAREYVSLGQPWAALRPVRAALALAPAHRFILRSAARFFLHNKDHEQAHDILRRAQSTRTDPWLVAAEIAVAGAANRHPSFVKTGRQLLESKNFSAFNISELASALGTLELEAGKVRLTKQLFRKALENPTENTMAQAAWISRKIGNWGFRPEVATPPRSYEACAWTSIMHQDWEYSLEAAELWLHDEPFSKRPTIFGSWAALTMAPDFVKAERIALHGLERHKDDFLLINNLTVALAYQGRHAEAVSYFKRIPPEEAEGPYKATYYATAGLLQFRLGASEEGRTLYRKAISEAKVKNHPQSAVWALLHLAKEEYRLAPPKGEAIVKEAREEFSKLLDIEQAMASRLIDVILPT